MSKFSSQFPRHQYSLKHRSPLNLHQLNFGNVFIPFWYISIINFPFSHSLHHLLHTLIAFPFQSSPLSLLSFLLSSSLHFLDPLSLLHAYTPSVSFLLFFSLSSSSSLISDMRVCCFPFSLFSSLVFSAFSCCSTFLAFLLLFPGEA